MISGSSSYSLLFSRDDMVRFSWLFLLPLRRELDFLVVGGLLLNHLVNIITPSVTLALSLSFMGCVSATPPSSSPQLVRKEAGGENGEGRKTQTITRMDGMNDIMTYPVACVNGSN